MIPITLSVVGGIGNIKGSWREVSFRSFAYVAGMTVIYSLLGVLAGITGRIFGSYTQHFGWYLGLGALMTFAALIMLDVIPFDPIFLGSQIKHKWKKWFQHKNTKPAKGSPPTNQVTHQEMSTWGAFALGATSGFIAAPCTTPVLTSILAFIAKTQSVGLGFLLMFSFSLGLGTLLLLLALFAGMIRILPRSGKWLKFVKIMSGLILLAFADYLIYRAGKLGGI
jgi:thiol:disulfide interchange protein DsbD